MVITDVIFQNRISSRKWAYKDLKGTIHKTEFIEVEKRHLSIGTTISTFNGFNTYLSVLYQDKKKRSYMASYAPQNASYSFGIYFRLF